MNWGKSGLARAARCPPARCLLSTAAALPPAGLPNSVAWLGWVAGPLCIIAFFSISLWSSIMLAGMYRIGAARGCVGGLAAGELAAPGPLWLFWFAPVLTAAIRLA